MENYKNVKINVMLVNIISFILAVIVLFLTVLIKIYFMNEKINLRDRVELRNGLILFLIIMFGGLIVHEIVKFIIYKIYRVKSVKAKIKNTMFYLYSKDELTIKQARVLWMFPYLLVIIATVISFIYFNFYVTFSFAVLLVGTGDDLLMFWYLLKFNKNDKFIQEEDFLGFTCYFNA